MTAGPHRAHPASAWGPAGSLFAALCCLGVAPVLAALGAVGLGFVVDDSILLPLLTLFLGATLWALRRDRSRHGRAGPLIVGIAGALATLGGLWVSGIVVGVGLVLLVTGSVWNWFLVRSTRPRRDPGPAWPELPPRCRGWDRVSPNHESRHPHGTRDT